MRLSPTGYRFSLKPGLLLAALTAGVGPAAGFEQATLRRMVEGRQVFIDQQPAQLQQSAKRGQQISTRSSRAELLFDRKALGYLGKNSLITLGQSCFRLQEGHVLINGRQQSCLGSRVLGVRGTTYALSRLTDGHYQLSVLLGEVRIANADAEPGPDDGDEAPGAQDILQRYPRLNPVVDLGSSAYGSNAGGKALGEAMGLVLGDAGIFLPLHQADGSRVLYNYSRANSNFDGFSGISSELGYRWFDANNRSLNGGLIGYDGWQGYGCFRSQLAVGAEWERNRWQFTALGGIPLDSCTDSIGYAMAGVAVPISRGQSQSAHLGLSPYVLHGNGENYGGGRLSLDVPIGPHLDLMAYSQYDGLLNTTVGGQIRVRFPVGNGAINDPNHQPLSPASPLPWQGNRSRQGISIASVSREPRHATLSDGEGWLSAAGEGDVVVQAGEEALLDADGQLIRKQTLSQAQFDAVVELNLKGQHLLPESHAISRFYRQRYQQPAPPVLAVLGQDWYVNARDPMPRQRGSNNLQVPPDKLPKAQAESPTPNPKPTPNPTPTPPQNVLTNGLGI